MCVYGTDELILREDMNRLLPVGLSRPFFLPRFCAAQMTVAEARVGRRPVSRCHPAAGHVDLSVSVGPYPCT